MADSRTLMTVLAALGLFAGTSTEAAPLDFVSDAPGVQAGRGRFKAPADAWAYIWTKGSAYSIENDRDTVVEAEVFLPAPTQELIIAFSENRRQWGQEGADALTLAARVSDWSLRVRSGVFATDFDVDGWAPPGDQDHGDGSPSWHRIEICFSRHLIVMRIDGEEIGVADPSKTIYPAAGSIGFIVAPGPDAEGKSMRVRNFKVRSKPRPPYLLGADFDIMSPETELSADGFAHASWDAGYAWTRERAYDLSKDERVELSFETAVFADDDEVIVAFSDNRLFWGEDEADALTFSISTDSPSVWVRQQVFAKEIETEQSPGEVLPVEPEEWYKVKATLTKDNLTVEVNGHKVSNTPLKGAFFPLSGYVGFIQYPKDAGQDDEVAYRNIKVVATRPKRRGRGEETRAMRSTIPAAPTVAAMERTAGNMYALLFAVQDYRDGSGIKDLRYPIADSKALARVLVENYTFEASNVKVVENPSRRDIYGELSDLRKRLKKTDSLLVFFAGHGELNKEEDQGYWLPSDARNPNEGNWVSNSDIKTLIRAIPTRHTLLISDACYAGSIVLGERSLNAIASDAAAALQLGEQESRRAMTSGAEQTVPDKSVFIEYLIKRLKAARAPAMTANQLFNSLRTSVMNNSQPAQTPHYGVLRQIGDDGGEFVFIRRTDRGG